MFSVASYRDRELVKALHSFMCDQVYPTQVQSRYFKHSTQDQSRYFRQERKFGSICYAHNYQNYPTQTNYVCRNGTKNCECTKMFELFLIYTLAESICEMIFFLN